MLRCFSVFLQNQAAIFIYIDEFKKTALIDIFLNWLHL